MNDIHYQKKQIKLLKR